MKSAFFEISCLPARESRGLVTQGCYLIEQRCFSSGYCRGEVDLGQFCHGDFV